MLRRPKFCEIRTSCHPFNKSNRNPYALFFLIIRSKFHGIPNGAGLQTSRFSSAGKSFDKMPPRILSSQNSIRPHYLNLVRSFLHRSSVITVAALHCLTLKTGSLADISNSTYLLTSYARAGHLVFSWDLFDETITKDVIFWNAMISACVYNQCFQAAVKLFGEMIKDINEFDSTTLLIVLSAVSRLHSINEGRVLHGISLKLHNDSNSFLSNALIDMYAKCGDLISAKSVFVRMEFKDAASWNSMMRGYLYNDCPEVSLSYFREMSLSRVRADTVSLSCVISACSRLGELDFGESVHSWVMKLGYGDIFHVSIANALLSLYLKCDKLDAAKKVFFGLVNKDVISWNTMIHGLAEKGRALESLDFLHMMQLNGESLPDSTTVVSVLPLCSHFCLWQEGKSLHGFMLRREMGLDLPVKNSLIDMYMKCGDLKLAEHLFKAMPGRDLVSWNTMITGYSHNGCSKAAHFLFRELLHSGLECSVSTVLAILTSCSCHEALQFGKSIHCWNLKSGFSNISAVNALLSMYINCGDMVASFFLFRSISEVAGVDSWNSLIVGCVKNGFPLEALEAFNLMHRLSHVNPDPITLVSILSASGNTELVFYGRSIHCLVLKLLMETDLRVRNVILSMYCRFGDTESAELIFHTSHNKNLCTWNCMISGFSQNKDGRRALEFFRHIEFEPNEMTIVGILTACTQLAALRHGREINGCVFRLGLHQNAFILAALVDMYSKSGRLDIANRVFQCSVEKSVASWNSMISAYGIHGYGKKAIELFSVMCRSDIKATKSTFISLLSACSHSGLVDEGLWHYNRMSEEFGVMPTTEHHVCVVDMLGRAGRLAEAYEFIKQIPRPAPGVWGALLSACKEHKDLKMGKSVAQHLFYLEPENIGYYVSLSNIYAAAGKWNDAVDVRRMAQDRGLKKPPGFSMVDVCMEQEGISCI